MPNRYRGTPAARRIDGLVAASPRSAAAIAGAVDMLPQHLSMIRTGSVALPPERCAPLARELGLDPVEMLALCLRSYLDHRSWRAIRLATGL